MSLSRYIEHCDDPARACPEAVANRICRELDKAENRVDSAVSFERFRTALEAVEGSSGKARASMDWIESFAVKTPFELEQVTGAFVKLRSDGMDPTRGLLRTLGDAAAAAGKPLMRAVEAMTGAVSGDNRGLADFGIEARAVEGGKIRYEYEVGGETKIAEAMAADGAQIRQVLGGILDAKYRMRPAAAHPSSVKKFGGAMAEESKTFAGMLGNLADQWARFRNMVMASGLFDFLKGRLGALLDTLDRMAAGKLGGWLLSELRGMEAGALLEWRRMAMERVAVRGPR